MAASVCLYDFGSSTGRCYIELILSDNDLSSLDEFRKLIASMPQHLTGSENTSDSAEDELGEYFQVSKRSNYQ